MNLKEKRNIKIRYSIALELILEENKRRLKNDAAKVEKHKLVTSLRKLEASSGISFSIIQKISKGEKNPALTTIAAIADGLNLTLSAFFEYFDKITEEDIKKTTQKNKDKASSK